MKRLVRLFLKTVVPILLLFGIAVPFLRPYTFHGTVLQFPEPAYDFTLQVKDGTIRLSDFRGKVVLLYFGYTFCPDVCPATLGTLAQAIRQLGKKGEQVQVIMVSVDPQRDTPERMAEYVHHFDPSFIGGTSTPQEIAKIASLYGVFYEISTETTASGAYLINHTATVMVIDRNGYLKLVIPFGATAEDIAEDLKHILQK